MSIKDKPLERQLLNLLKKLEETNDRVGPTPLRHRINEMVINARTALREFDQEKYDTDENWTAPPAWANNPATIAASFIPNADPESVAKSEAYCDATGIERNVQTALRSGVSQDDRPRFFMDAPARMTPPLPAAGFMNLGIKASAFVEALNDLCHAHGVQIKSFSPVLVIMNLAHNEEPIDFPEIQDRT